MNRQSISINILRRNQGYNKKEDDEKEPKSLLRRRRRRVRVVKRLSRSVKDDDAEDDGRTHAEDDGCAGV